MSVKMHVMRNVYLVFIIVVSIVSSQAQKNVFKIESLRASFLLRTLARTDFINKTWHRRSQLSLH